MSDGPSISNVQPFCKHWFRNKSCIFGDKCKFRHDIVEELKLDSISVDRPRKGFRRRQKVCNDGRVSVLRRWLLKVFDKEFLNSGSGIIDVAGGKGELSFELLILNDIKSTVFDPRPLELSKFVRKYLLGYYQKNEILKSYNTVVDNKSSSVKTLKIPPQIRGYFEVTDSETNPPVDFTFPTILTNQDIYLENISKSTHTGWGLKHSLQSLQLTSFSSIYSWVEGQNEGIICQLCNISNECLSLEGESDGSIPFEKALQTLQHCSIIVGMHPDQAAEHIVNWAIRNNKPFAIIPCCVFARRFPKRQLKDGKSVTSYGDLISYLMEKHSDIQAVEMDFEGRNVLLYFLAGVPVHYDVHNNNVAIAPDPLVVRGRASADRWNAIH